MDNRILGQRIAELRKKKGLNQIQLAEVLGISNKTVSKWETGEGCPEITMLEQLSKTLDVTIEHLLTGKETPIVSRDFFNVKKYYIHKDIPVKWPHFWGSMTIFNKIAAIIIALIPIGLIPTLLVPIYELNLYYGKKADIVAVLHQIFVNDLPEFGLWVALLGLVLGALDYWDRQEKVSIIQIVILGVVTFKMIF